MEPGTTMDQDLLTERGSVVFESKNVRGLSEEKFEDLIHQMQRGGAAARGIQETWRIGNFTEENKDYTIIHNGPSKKPSRRGSLGVGIVLSKSGTKAWDAAARKREKREKKR